ncbi:MAG: Eco57I restriction-modification methylase domain-containing protein [Clostridia bacterium]
MGNLIDIDSALIRSVLPMLLVDKSAYRNLIWATDTYEGLGESYSPNHEMTPRLVSGMGSLLIQPRTAKTADDQQARTKKHAEVFTPAWICNRMINHCDAVWFGREDVFNQECGTDWTPTQEKIVFPKPKKWQHYVDSRRLEITCGEAPYLVSRYDASTGDSIPFEHRIGLLDRKLRIVNENTADEADWLKWTLRAFQSVYGFEFQGDSLLIARINLLSTFMEALEARWHRAATRKELHAIANVIAWNLWQMDGLKGTVPFGTLQEAYQQITLWDLLGESNDTSMERPMCRIMDWRGHASMQYSTRMTRKGTAMKFDFVIGNPPYQDEQIGSNNQSKPVYNLFMDSAYTVGKKVELITPGRFLSHAGATPKEWNNKMLQSRKVKVLYYEKTSAKVFNGVDIKGGVVITYFDEKGDYDPIDVFIETDELRSVFMKTHEKSNGNVGDLVHSPDSYRFNDVLFSEHPELIGRTDKTHAKAVASSVFDRYPEIFKEIQESNDVGVVGRKNGMRQTLFTKTIYLNDNGNLHKWKVLVAGAIGTGNFGEVLSDPIIVGPEAAHTQTFVSMGEFNSEFEAKALLRYFKTKFARALLGIMKTTQNNQSKVVWSKIPLQDFTPSSDIDWSAAIPDIDKQLYRKYGLSSDEIAFIETHVKEMA